MAHVVGQRIRQRRQQLGLTLRQLAERVDLTAGYLSRVENDRVTPSFDTLKAISHALEIPLLYFIDSHASAPVTRAKERPSISVLHTAMTYEPLTPEWASSMRAMLLRMKPGARRQVQPLSARNDQLLFLVSGRLTINIDGAVHDLSPHDSIFFDGNLVHEYVSCGDEEAVFVIVVVPPTL